VNFILILASSKKIEKKAAENSEFCYTFTFVNMATG
jgi:hypothetical protein